jgi:hypothetical protein
MVKRPKSPEVVEDSRFFTIFLPYPLNGDWQNEEDTKKLAWWIAECIGEEHLWAILWKPSVRLPLTFSYRPVLIARPSSITVRRYGLDRSIQVLHGARASVRRTSLGRAVEEPNR